MTKEELIVKIQELYEQVDDLETLLHNLTETKDTMRNLLDKIEVDEITDDTTEDGK